MGHEFWSGFACGVVALAGILGAIGTYLSKRHGGGSPSAKKAEPHNVYLAAILGNKRREPARKPRKRRAGITLPTSPPIWWGLSKSVKPRKKPRRRAKSKTSGFGESL